MTGVPGKIFAPMSLTYGLALTGALLMAFTLAPALCVLLLAGECASTIRRSSNGSEKSGGGLAWRELDHEVIVIALAGGALAVAIFAVPFIGGEFLPALEEGNIWMRATLPVDISFEQAAQLATDIRQVFGDVPEVVNVASQLSVRTMEQIRQVFSMPSSS